jgi:hypothetical protein
MNKLILLISVFTFFSCGRSIQNPPASEKKELETLKPVATTASTASYSNFPDTMVMVWYPSEKYFKSYVQGKKSFKNYDEFQRSYLNQVFKSSKMSDTSLQKQYEIYQKTNDLGCAVAEDEVTVEKCMSLYEEMSQSALGVQAALSGIQRAVDLHIPWDSSTASEQEAMKINAIYPHADSDYSGYRFVLGETQADLDVTFTRYGAEGIRYSTDSGDFVFVGTRLTSNGHRVFGLIMLEKTAAGERTGYKVLFEVEESFQFGKRRYIGKIYRSKSGQKKDVVAEGIFKLEQPENVDIP